MAFSLFGIIKGLLVQDETDKSKQISLEIDSGSTTNTKTILKSAQTANRTLTLPDATDTLVGKATTDILTNKSIDADTNTITNIENADIKAAAAIDATKIADGTVTNTEFQYINSLTSNVQTQIDDHLGDASDAHDASAISNVPSGNLAATEVQAALNELQSDIDTRALQTSLNDHINDATDAHDASAISNVPSGNLVATDVQAALNELQGDIDGIGTFANQTLSNLTNPTSINQDLVLNTGANATVKTVDSAAAATKALSLKSGTTTGNFATGIVDVGSGDTDDSATSGITNVLTGSNSTGTGSTGAMTIRTGNQLSATGTGVTGSISMNSGNKGGTTGNTGNVSITTGNAVNSTSGASGTMVVKSGNTTSPNPVGNTGTASYGSGICGSLTSGDSGLVTVESGQLSATGSGSSGIVRLRSGSNTSSGTGSTGNVEISTGSKSSGTGNSGNLSLTVGTATGTQGVFKFLKTGVASVSGQIWTASSTDGTGYWANATTDLVNDTSPQLGGDLDVNGNDIEGVSSEIVLAGQNMVRRAKQASKASFVEEEYIHSISLLASQTNTVITALTFAHATYAALEITYYLKDLASDYRLGTIRVVTNGSTVTLNDTYTENISNGITFDAVINGANIEVRYTTGANTATLRADIKRFLT